MQGKSRDEILTNLNAMLAEASRALVQLDAARLEELALSCEALNRTLPSVPAGDTAQLPAPRQQREWALFGRVLELTRGNLHVMRQVRRFEDGITGYSRTTVITRASGAESHGNN